MKKIWAVTVVVLALAVAPAFAQEPDTSYNFGVFTIPEIPEAPVIDGDLSDSVWANVPEFPVMENGDNDAPTEEGDLDVVAKVAWHDATNALYFGISVVDESYCNVNGLGASTNGEGWHNERVEIIIDGINSGEAGDLLQSGYHQQYTFDMPNIWDNDNPDGGEYGMADVPVSTSFIPVKVYERISSAVEPPHPDGYPFDLSDDYVQSAARLRATEERPDWIEAPVEFVWEIKLVIFEELLPNSVIGMDFEDPANIANGFNDYFADPDQIVKDLEVNQAIGFTIQQNDGDIFAESPTREHQNNTTGFSGNWNSSENLSALILGAPVSDIGDWSLR